MVPRSPLVLKRLDQIQSKLEHARQRAVESLSDEHLEALASCLDFDHPAPEEQIAIDAYNEAFRKECRERLN